MRGETHHSRSILCHIEEFTMCDGIESKDKLVLTTETQMRIHKSREKKVILITEAELGEELSLSLLVPHISYHRCLLTLSKH